jgi:hypothetical protein
MRWMAEGLLDTNGLMTTKTTFRYLSSCASLAHVSAAGSGLVDGAALASLHAPGGLQ